ncbi:3810_t:CDS:2, partial [Acaulospora morrowiae]
MNSIKDDEFLQTFMQIKHNDILLPGELHRPTDKNTGICVFVHGSGSSRFSPRYIAKVLRSRGIGTFLLDLLTPEEEQIDEVTRHLRFNIEMLAERVVSVIDHFGKGEDLKGLPIGLFGASTGGGAALLAALKRPDRVRLVISGK